MQLTYLEQGVLNYLIHFRNYISRYGRLEPDGSFFRADEVLAKKFWVSRVTIWTIKKKLKALGYIDYKSYSGAGKATVYWILDDFKPQEKAKAPVPKVESQIKGDWLKSLVSGLSKSEARERLLKRDFTKEEIKKVIEAMPDTPLVG